MIADLPVGSPEYDALEGIPAPSHTRALVGHADIKAFLANAIVDDRIHHALLFEGPQGIGKATLAFQLAGHLLSHQNRETPVGELAVPDFSLSTYRQIAAGTHPAVMHVSRPFDPKTEKFKTMITVDEIRKTSHFLARTSHDGAWRIIIVDPADDMNRNAANALLKTLEEPPQRVLFILISHSSGRLLPTIRSRCQSVRFHPLSDDDVRTALLNAGMTESEDTPLDAVVQRSEGSVRRAALLLTYGGVEIADTVDSVLDGVTFDVAKAQTLAGVLSGRDSEIQYGLFLEHLLRRISTAAERFAMAGAVQRASQWSAFWEQTSRDAVEAAAFNLDRKQTISIFLNRAHRAFQQGMPV